MICRLFIFAALLVVAGTVVAAPPRVSNLAGRQFLSDNDRADIEEYAQYWGRKLGGGDPLEVDAAQAKLIDPLRAPEVSDNFRVEYGRELLPMLEAIVDDAPTHTAVNAMQVASLLGTPDAIDLILRHISVETEEDFGIRLWAAHAFPLAVRQGVVPDKDVTRALRRLGAAAAREESWLVLRRQFDAIASVDNEVSHEIQLDVLKKTAERMQAQPDSSDLMRATYPSLLQLRNEYINLIDIRKQEAIGKSLAPILCELCTVAEQHWDSAQRDDDARQAYGGAIQISESLLKVIDAHVRAGRTPLPTRLKPAWDDRDKIRFNADHDKWRKVLSGPPYTMPR